VWRGLGCWPSSNVWSVGVTVSRISLYVAQLIKKLAHWLSPSIIFGAKDKIVQGLTEAWCIAKIRRLIGPLDPPVNPEFEEEFLLAEHLESTTFEHPDTKLETQFIKVGRLRQELEKLPGPRVSSELIDFIEYLLVVDHTKRPTALEALQHPYLRSLR
jgi:serine/threonine protein kinase